MSEIWKRILQFFNKDSSSSMPMPKRAFPDNGIEMFDKVKILSSKETEEMGLAGQIGIVFGQTVPSSSGVENVIGDKGDDYAVAVCVDDSSDPVWIAGHLVEFSDTNSGTQLTLQVSENETLKFEKNKDGSWTEIE